MDAADAVEQAEPKKRGRKPKSTPIADAQSAWAEQARQNKKNNPVVEKYYELVNGRKFILCHKTATGSVYRTIVGTTDHKEYGKDVQAQVDKLKKQGLLRYR